MGNVGSIFSNQSLFEQSIGPLDEDKNIASSHQTPTRFDPRSPTADIDRTPIIMVDLANSHEKVEEIEDPRSPSVGIVRTPVAPVQSVAVKEETVEKEKGDELIQALNFTDLDHLSISNIEEINEETRVVHQLEPITICEDTIEFSPMVIGATSTPAPSPVKPTKKRPTSNNFIYVDENSFNAKSSSPFNSITAQLGRARVPFGDVNRPAMASPRLQLQNKQKIMVRSEIQHQRFAVKTD